MRVAPRQHWMWHAPRERGTTGVLGGAPGSVTSIPRKQASSMAVHSITNHQRKAAPAHQVAAKPSRPAGAVHATAAPKRDHPRTLIGKIAVIERVAQRSGTSVKASSAIVN